MKILLVRNDNIGDLINTTPAIFALRQAYPKAQIDILVNSENQCAIFNNLSINNIYTYTKSKHVAGFIKKLKSVFNKLVLIKKLKKNHYDWAIFFRFDLSKNSLCWMQAKKTIGTNPRFTHPVIPSKNFNSNLHEALFCLELLKPLGIIYSQDPIQKTLKNLKTNFYLPENLKKLGVLYKNSLGIHISTRLEKNLYPESQFLILIKKLCQELPHLSLVLTCAPKEIPMAENLAQIPGVLFTKTNSFLEAAAVFSQCPLVLTLDGGLAHVFPALGIQTMTLMAHDKISRWHPWGMQDLVISNPTGPCADISPELIVSKIKQILESKKILDTLKTLKITEITEITELLEPALL